MNDDNAWCVLRHRDDRRKRALSTALVCRTHDGNIRDDLRDIADLYPLLPHVAEPGSVMSDELVRYAKRPDPAAPIRLEVVTLTDARTTWDPSQPDAISVLATLAGWAGIVREEQRLSATRHATVVGEVNLLRVHHDFVIAQAWVDEYAKEIHRVAQAIRHACGEHEAPPVGRCAASIHDGEPCGGPLYPDRYGLMRVRCARCGETWDEDDLRRLGLVLES